MSSGEQKKVAATGKAASGNLGKKPLIEMKGLREDDDDEDGAELSVSAEEVQAETELVSCFQQ